MDPCQPDWGILYGCWATSTEASCLWTWGERAFILPILLARSSKETASRVSVSASGASSVAVSDTVAWSSSGAKYVVASGVSVEPSEADSLPPQVRGRQRSGRKKSRVLSLFCVFFGKGKNKEGNYLHKMIFPTGDWNFFTHKDNCTNN